MIIDGFCISLITIVDLEEITVSVSYRKMNSGFLPAYGIYRGLRAELLPYMTCLIASYSKLGFFLQIHER